MSKQIPTQMKSSTTLQTSATEAEDSPSRLDRVKERISLRKDQVLLKLLATNSRFHGQYAWK
jgi:hypothetical protein